MEPEEERLFVYAAEDIVGDQSHILKVLRNATLHDDLMIDDVSRRVKNLGASLEYYNEYLLKDKLEDKAKKLNSKKTLITQSCKFSYYVKAYSSLLSNIQTY